MSDLTVTKTRFAAGRWEGIVSGVTGDLPPGIEVTLELAPVEGVTFAPLPEAGQYAITVPVPVDAIGDGIHTFVLRNTADDAVLATFVVLAGEAMADTMRAEIDLLREELDLLKRAFRRHCVETA